MFIKFPTNIPVVLTFKYDTGKEYDGKFGKQWNWSVTSSGQEATVSATETLNRLLEALTPTGKTLQILKYEDGTKKLWKIMDSAGTDITPKASMSTPTPKTPVNANSDQIEAIQKRLDAASTAFKSLKEEIDYLKTENAILRDKIDKLEKFIIPVI